MIAGALWFMVYAGNFDIGLDQFARIFKLQIPRPRREKCAAWRPGLWGADWRAYNPMVCPIHGVHCTPIQDPGAGGHLATHGSGLPASHHHGRLDLAAVHRAGADVPAVPPPLIRVSTAAVDVTFDVTFADCSPISQPHTTPHTPVLWYRNGFT